MRKTIIILAIVCMAAPVWGVIELRQSTIVDVLIGPFSDATDGVTRETALTINAADVYLSKNGAAAAVKNQADDPCSTGTLGWYICTLDATDTGTLGNLWLDVNDQEANSVPVWHEYAVITANYWDSKYSTDKLDVSVVQWLGTACLTPNTAGIPMTEPNRIDGTTLELGLLGTDDIPTTEEIRAEIDANSTQLAAILADTGTDGVVLANDAITAAKIAADAIGASEAGFLTDSTGFAGADIASILTDTGTTIPGTLTSMSGATFNAATDSLEAIRNRGDSAWTTGGGSSAMLSTTVDTVTSDKEFTVAAGIAEDDVYEGMSITVTDADGENKEEIGVVRKWTGSTLTVKLNKALTFTPANGDTVKVYATNPLILSIYLDLQGAF